MSESLQHIIDGMYESEKKHSDLDIPIRINLDNNLSTFIPGNELMELVEQVKTKLKKTLPVQCMCDEIIKLLNQLPYGKKEICLKDIIETLDNLETYKVSVEVTIYNLDINKDKLEIGNYSLSRKKGNSYTSVALKIKNTDTEMPLDCLGEYEIVDDSISIFRNFLLVALGKRRLSQSITNRFTQDSTEHQLTMHNGSRIHCISSSKDTTNTHCKPSIILNCDLFKQYHSGLFLLVSKDRSEIESKLYKSIIWLGESLSNQNIGNSFLQIAIALECLLSYQEKGYFIQPSMTYSLAETAAFLYSMDLNIRKDIFKKIKKYYAKRSSIVHSGQSKVTLHEYYDFFHIVKTCLYNSLL